MTGGWSTKPYRRLGYLVVLFGIVGGMLWAATARIDGAVIAKGVVGLRAGRQVLQHPDGGVVAEIPVRDGQLVARGAAILRLDPARLDIERQSLERQLHETQARIDRLTAELAGAAAPDFREGLAAATDIVATEQTLFASRMANRRQTLAQLSTQQDQTRAQIAGLTHQLAALQQQLALTQAELATQQDLLANGLARATNVATLERETIRLQGLSGEIEARIAEARSHIAGLEIEKLRSRARWQETAQTDLREQLSRERALLEQGDLLAQKSARLILRAPVTGIVTGLKVFTIGAVIPAGAEIARIVPQNAPNVLEVRIPVREIDRLHTGQQVTVRFPSQDGRMTPIHLGQVDYVAADTMRDPASGAAYYPARVSLLAPQDSALPVLLPGMPVEVLVRTSQRSVLSYLLRPFADFLAMALREE